VIEERSEKVKGMPKECQQLPKDELLVKHYCYNSAKGGDRMIINIRFIRNLQDRSMKTTAGL
jgi:hypothetical protein